MLSVKVALRQISNVPNAGADIFTPEQVEQDFAYKYSDYTLQQTHYLGEIKDSHNVILGYKMMFVFVRQDAPQVANITDAVVPARRGRPKGSNNA